jgi:hypothetical protein
VPLLKLEKLVLLKSKPLGTNAAERQKAGAVPVPHSHAIRRLIAGTVAFLARWQTTASYTLRTPFTGIGKCRTGSPAISAESRPWRSLPSRPTTRDQTTSRRTPPNAQTCSRVSASPRIRAQSPCHGPPRCALNRDRVLPPIAACKRPYT